MKEKLTNLVRIISRLINLSFYFLSFSIYGCFRIHGIDE
jgi:hypothetical protein